MTKEPRKESNTNSPALDDALYPPQDANREKNEATDLPRMRLVHFVDVSAQAVILCAQLHQSVTFAGHLA